MLSLQNQRQNLICLGSFYKDDKSEIGNPYGIQRETFPGDSYREWPEHVKFFIFEFSAADRLVFGLEI